MPVASLGFFLFEYLCSPPYLTSNLVYITSIILFFFSPSCRKNAVPPPEPTEFDNLSLKDLKSTVVKLRDEVGSISQERSRITADRDALERFLELSKKDLREAELAVIAKTREAEAQAETHRIEMKVYEQKIKHLEYEHSHSMGVVESKLEEEIKGEEELHLKKEALLRAEKTSLRGKARQMEESQAEANRQARTLQDRSLGKMKAEFRATLDSLIAKYEARLKSLQEDLNLRHRVEVHEVEERKNLHLNQLVRAHEEAFAEIKTYYNNITRANLELITTLKAQITEANEKQAANQKMMVEIAEENKRLSGPLQRATAELNSLQSDLKDTEKDKQSLEYAKTRLRSLRSQVSELEHVYADTERKYTEVESERDELYAKFEATVRLAQAKGEARQEVLESNLAAAEQQAIAKRLQVEQVISAAKLDPHVLVSVADKLDSELETRARTIRDLQSGISRLAKAHDDALRVFFSRMREYDVPEEVIQSLPVSFMGAPSSGPAGLVAKPPIA